MGGEPTFVAVDDFESPEWNTAAVGPTKRGLADSLIRRLRDRFGPAARYITARASGIRARACRAGPSACTGAATGSRCGRTPTSSPRRPARARRSGSGRAVRTAASPAGSASTRYVQPMFEDPDYWAKREAELRSTSRRSPRRSASRNRRPGWSRVYKRGVETPVGYVLPLTNLALGGDRVWVSERWEMKRGAIYLASGDFARRPAPAAGLAAVRAAGILPLTTRRRTRSSRAGRCRRAARPSAPRPSGRRGPHRARGRAARRRAVRVHAAAGTGRRVPRAARRDRGGGGRTRPAGPCRGLRAALRPAPQRHQGSLPIPG